MNTRQLIQSTNGRIFTATFTKKDGTTRRMNARLGAHVNLKGKGLNFKPEDKGLISVFDMQKHAYRFVNTETMSEFRCGSASWSK